MKTSLKSKLSLDLKDKIDRLSSEDSMKQLLDYHNLIDIPIDRLHWKIWKRPYGPNGYRLTEFGYIALERILKIQCWRIPLNVTNSSISSQDILRLDRHLTSPFFISTTPAHRWGTYNPTAPEESPYTFITFEESVAGQLLLYGNDLKYYLEALDIGSR
jgi:hypothetical protein